MGIRARIKGRIKQALGSDAPNTGPSTAPPAAPQPPARMTPQPGPASEPKPVSVAQASPKTDTDSGPKPISEEKVRKHMLKTRKGVLKMIIDSGGSSTLGEMHDYSERRYFVAHQKFSKLMESLIAEGQIDYDAAESLATITETGKAFVEA